MQHFGIFASQLRAAQEIHDVPWAIVWRSELAKHKLMGKNDRPFT
jgi:hypothetical protein